MSRPVFRSGRQKSVPMSLRDIDLAVLGDRSGTSAPQRKKVSLVARTWGFRTIPHVRPERDCGHYVPAPAACMMRRITDSRLITTLSYEIERKNPFLSWILCLFHNSYWPFSASIIAFAAFLHPTAHTLISLVTILHYYNGWCSSY